MKPLIAWIFVVMGSMQILGQVSVSRPPKAIIALVDSGMDTQNPELMKWVWVNPKETPDNNLDDDGNGCIDDISGCNVFNLSNYVYDNRGHGTYVASVLTGKSNLTSRYIAEISPEIKIFPIRSMSAEEAFLVDKNKIVGISYNSLDVIGSVESTVKAMDCVIATQKSTGDHFVMNASWSFSDKEEHRDLLESAFRRLEDAGILVIVAAGNNCPDAKSKFPSSMHLSNMISVGASNGERFADYSCQGGDIATEGTLLPELGKGYASYLRGTSFAAPTVALAAAQIWQRHPNLTAQEVKAVILGTSDTKQYLNGNVECDRLLNFEKAISW